MKKFIKYFAITAVLFSLIIIIHNFKKAYAQDNSLEDGIYIIKSSINEDYVFDIYNNSNENGANLELWKRNEGDNQKFNVKNLGNGYYKITLIHSDKCIDVEGNSKQSGANVLQWIYNGQDNQQWIIKNVGNENYNIISKSNGFYLDIPYSDVKPGANVQVWINNNGKNQQFKFEKIGQGTNIDNQVVEEENTNGQEEIERKKTIGDGIYTIKTVLDENYAIDICNYSNRDGAKVELWFNKNSMNQKFYIEYLGDGYYNITPVYSNKKIDVEGSAKKSGTNVLQWKNTGNDNQKWIIKETGNGNYNIISKCNGLYLDVTNSEAKNGTNMIVWEGNGGKNQLFKFEESEYDIAGSKTIDNGSYVIETKKADNMVLDIYNLSIDNGENLEVWLKNYGSNQKFRVKYLDNGCYKIYANHSGKCLDVEGASKEEGTNVVQWSENEGNNQQWIILDAGDGEYNIMSKCNGLYLTVDNDNVCVTKANDSATQKFKFEMVNAAPYIDTSKYPGYKDKIEKLINNHPNWKFELLYTGLKFGDVTAGECAVHSRNLVPTSYGGEWICPVCGTRLYDSGWYCASEKAVAYYMDPRNFLDETNIFQFLNLNSYTYGYCTLQGVQNKVDGTFLQNYANDIDTACRNQNVNSYYIIARLIQEQGYSGTSIGKGMDGGDWKTYYNPFNIGASGNGWNEIYSNALSTAKYYGWDTMEKAIEGGITFCKKNWLENYQNTLYQNKFDIDTRNGTRLYEHQYMQNLMAAYGEAITLRGMYSNTGRVDSEFTFIIPVYEEMSSIYQMPVNNSETSPINVKVSANGGLNLRSGASTDSSVLRTINEGEIVLSVQRGINSNWQKIVLTDGTIGYMSGTYLSVVNDVTNCNYTARVKTNDGSGCYVRVGPSTDLEKLTALADGTIVTVINKGTYNNIDGYDWCRIIIPDGRQAFMPIRFLQ